MFGERVRARRIGTQRNATHLYKQDNKLNRRQIFFAFRRRVRLNERRLNFNIRKDRNSNQIANK